MTGENEVPSDEDLKKADSIIQIEWAGECERTGATTFSNHSLTFLRDCIANALSALRASWEKERDNLEESISGLKGLDIVNEGIITRLEAEMKGLRKVAHEANDYLADGDSSKKLQEAIEALEAYERRGKV